MAVGEGQAFPEFKSKDSLACKYVTEEIWNKLRDHKTQTCEFTLEKAAACAIQFDDQHVGVYAGDPDSYEDFKEVFHPIILDYHGLNDDFIHESDIDPAKIIGNIDPDAPVKSTRIRVGRNIEGFGLSPGITKEQRLQVEELMKNAFSKLDGDLAGEYYPLTGMDEDVRQKLVDDHFLFMSGDKNLQASGMERDWPEGRGIFHNTEKTFLVWVNEEDQLRIISMEKGGDVKGVFARLASGIAAVGDSVNGQSGKTFYLHPKYGFLHSCPTNLGTGMRASVHIDLPGWTKEGLPALKERCKELSLQPRGTRGESGGHDGVTYDISNRHRLGYSEVQLVQTMIDGVNTLYKEDLALQEKHGIKEAETVSESYKTEDKPVETEQKPVESEQKPTESEQKPAESEQKPAEPEQKATESQENPSKSEEKSVDDKPEEKTTTDPPVENADKAKNAEASSSGGEASEGSSKKVQKKGKKSDSSTCVVL